MNTSYRAARLSLALLDFLTWMAAVAAALAAVRLYLTDQTALAFMVVGGAILFALFEFAATQFARAQIDTADNTADILEIMRRQVGRNEPTAGKAPPLIHDGLRREPTMKK